MGKIQDAGKSIRTFVDDVLGEMRKTTWPGRHELIGSTMVVIVSLIMIALFVGICDKVVAIVLRVLIRAG